MIGTVYQSTGLWYKVKLEAGNFIECRLKGKLRLDDLKTTNPVAVGDKVIVEKDESGKNLMISGIEKRHNYIIRASPRHKNKNHIIGANIDQSFCVVSLKSPRTRLGFIDRFLVSCEMYHVPAIILFNKSDLYKAKEMAKFEELKALYESIGYPVYLISAEQKVGLEPIKELIKGKVSLISGQSGVGKSSLLNALVDLEIKTKVISGYNEKGQHTTTYATMYDLDEGGAVIDTPGIKQLGLINLEPEEVSHYFPEMRNLLNECKYQNCSHLTEPNCAIIDAFEKEEIAESRFIAYEVIYNDIKETNHWLR